MGHDRADGTRAYFHCGGEYRDEWTRTSDGWRIDNRFEQTIWMDGESPARCPADPTSISRAPGDAPGSAGLRGEQAVHVEELRTPAQGKA